MRGDGEIKRVSANVKAQFPADGYELMEDVDADADEDAFPVSRRGEIPGVFAFIFFAGGMMVTAEER